MTEGHLDWTRAIDAYCERTDAGYWSEPVNALTNAAFLIAAILMWRRTPGLPLARALAAVLFVIGIGSWLFHTHATAWAATADVIPILGYILLYIYIANRAYLGWRPWVAALGAAGFIPWTLAVSPVFAALPFFEISSFYWSVPLLIALYAVALRRRLARVARGLGIGAAILCASLTFRSLDAASCAWVPFGTHFLWHILNATMLAWMIEVYRRHALAGAGAGR